MRLVDDDRIGARQQIAEALLLQHQIRHQQMMIDDDDVGGLRLAARLHDVTAIERRALRPETVVARRGHPGPHGIGFAELRQLGDIAVARDRATTRAPWATPSRLRVRSPRAIACCSARSSRCRHR